MEQNMIIGYLQIITHLIQSNIPRDILIKKKKENYLKNSMDQICSLPSKILEAIYEVKRS